MCTLKEIFFTKSSKKLLIRHLHILDGLSFDFASADEMPNKHC